VGIQGCSFVLRLRLEHKCTRGLDFDLAWSPALGLFSKSAFRIHTFATPEIRLSCSAVLVDASRAWLKVRLGAPLDRRVGTEAGRRKLDEEGKACALILNARLERSERRLAELSSDPESSLAEIAGEVRAANELACESRASWLATR
jgi:hypothetical protein